MTALTAINVLLKPDVATRERAKAVNALLRGDLPSGFALDETHEPHLTVLQRYVRRADLDGAIAAVRDVVAELDAAALRLHAVGLTSGRFGTPPGTVIASIAIEPAAALLDLQRDLVEALIPLTASGGSAAAFVTTADEPHVGDTIIAYVEEFVPAHCGEHYSSAHHPRRRPRGLRQQARREALRGLRLLAERAGRVPARRSRHRPSVPRELAAAPRSGEAMTATEAPSTQWPAVPYEELAPTMHLLHMGLQMVGKLTLLKPFEPQWANVTMAPVSRGLTTGAIPWRGGTFAIDADFVSHELGISTSWGTRGGMGLGPMSVADWHDRLFSALGRAGVHVTINEMPQEVPDPVPFTSDAAARPYDTSLVEAWWQAMHVSAGVMQEYRACFRAKTPPIGFMWGTFDLRVLRLGGTRVPATGINVGYIRRNAMDEDQVESGWWPGSPTYPRPAYYSFTHPQPAGIEQTKPRPATAHWDAAQGTFILDYDDVRADAHPEGVLRDFLDSTYEAGARLAGWDPGLICSGVPQPAPKGETT